MSEDSEHTASSAESAMAANARSRVRQGKLGDQAFRERQAVTEEAADEARSNRSGDPAEPTPDNEAEGQT